MKKGSNPPPNFPKPPPPPAPPIPGCRLCNKLLASIAARKQELLVLHRDLCRGMVPGDGVKTVGAKLELLEELERLFTGEGKD